MSKSEETEPQRVTVIDFDIAFRSLIWLMVKIVLAVIPAAILVLLIFAAFGSVITGLVRGLFPSVH